MRKDVAISVIDKALGYLDKEDYTEEEINELTNETIDYYLNHFSPSSMNRRAVAADKSTCDIEWKAEGEDVYDIKGNHYVDYLGGYGVYTTGHNNPYIRNVALKAMNQIGNSSNALLNPWKAYAAKIMADVTPGDLQYVKFALGGGEAVEYAMKIARLATGGRWFISSTNSYHGKSFGAVALTGRPKYSKALGSTIENVLHVEYGNAIQLRKTVKALYDVGDSVAAVFLEPIQGEGGIIVPPKGYFKQVREICSEYGIAMVADEIQTGLSRTGTLFRCDAEGVVPDIMTFAKTAGGGILPQAGIIVRPWVWHKSIVEEGDLVFGGATMGGYPAGTAVNIATIRYLLYENISDVCKEKGDYFLSFLKELEVKYPNVIKEVRGAGLLIGIEMVSDSIGAFISKYVYDKDRIFLAGVDNSATVVRIEPTSNVSQKYMDIAKVTIEEAIQAAIKEFNL